MAKWTDIQLRNADDPGSALSEGTNFFLSFFFFSQINNCQQKKKQTNKQTKQKGELRF